MCKRKQSGWKTALKLGPLMQDPYGNIGVVLKDLFMSYKVLQISHFSDYFLHIKVLMFVGSGPSSPYRHASLGCI
jgi:hypothetical protein